jgi:hypothetical protein
MRIRFLEIAEMELDEAIQYYNYEVAGLGDDFLTEVLNTLDRIARFPEAWHPYSKRTRRCQTRRFPYGINLPGPKSGNTRYCCCKPAQRAGLLGESTVERAQPSNEPDKQPRSRSVSYIRKSLAVVACWLSAR